MDDDSGWLFVGWLAIAVGSGAAAYVNYRWWWWIHPNRSLLDLSKERTGPEVETLGDMLQKWVPTTLCGAISILAIVNTGVAVYRLI